jgi:hypothetical protein
LSAASSVICDGAIPLGSEARRGLSLLPSSASPSCTYGPKRPCSISTGLPVRGSVPSTSGPDDLARTSSVTCSGVRSAGATPSGSEAVTVAPSSSISTNGTELADPHPRLQVGEAHRGGVARVDALLARAHQRVQPLGAAEEGAEVREPLRLALGDLVELLLHPRVKRVSTRCGEVPSRSPVTAKAVKVGVSEVP